MMAAGRDLVARRRATGGMPIADRWLAVGAVLPDALPPATVGWRVVSGALRVDAALPSAGSRGPAGSVDHAGCAQLALPGDLLQLVPTPDHAPGCRVRALVGSCVTALPEPGDPASWLSLLWQAVEQQRRRSAEMALLRVGPAPERMRLLLLLLATPSADGTDAAEGAQPLPSLRDLADIVAAAPETVSRVLSGLRRLQLLEDRQPRAGRYHAGRLASEVLPRRLVGAAARAAVETTAAAARRP
jgi:hypothetical protein